MRKKRCKNITSKAAKGALAAILALAMTVPLAACKDSDVLTEKIVGEVGEYDIDYDIPPVALDNPESEDSMTDEYEEEESERENEEEENTPEYDEENQTTDETTNEQVATTTTTTMNNRKATTGGSSSGSGRTGGGSTRGSSSNASSTGKRSASSLTGTGSEGESNRWVISLVPPDDTDATEDVDDLTNSAGGTENNSNLPEDTWDPSSESSDPNIGVNDQNTGAQIVQAGQYDNMTPSNGIAAVGTYALIVQALGGSGALKACNAEWYDSLPAQSFSNKSELTNTVKISAWGDGTTMNQETFDAIVNSGADTVLTSASYGGVTQSWAEQFLAANISVVELEPIGMANAYDADISTCVQVIGQLLKDSGCSVTVGGTSYNSAQMANTWQSQHDIAIEATHAANGGYAVHTAGGYSWPIIYQSWDLANGSPIDTEHTRFSTTYFDDWEFNDPTLSGVSSRLTIRRYTNDVSVWPWNDFNISNEYDIHVDGSLGYPTGITAPYLNDFNSSYFYVSTYYLQCAGLDDLRTENIWCNNVMSRKVSGTDGSETYKVYPGNMNMPCIIAKDTSIAERVIASASIADRSTNTVGFLNFGKDYRIVIMPSGVSGCWADGTFESFLIAPWSYCAVTDGNIDMSSIDGYVSNFYDTFYRCSADGIVNGSGSYWGSYLVAVANRDE